MLTPTLNHQTTPGPARACSLMAILWLLSATLDATGQPAAPAPIPEPHPVPAEPAATMPASQDKGEPIATPAEPRPPIPKAPAASVEPGDPAAAASTAGQAPSTMCLRSTVCARRPTSPGAVLLEAGTLAERGAVHLGEVVTEVPGVAAVRRSLGSPEPVLRGLGGERVRTQVGLLPLHGACPSGMDPPITYLSPALARSASLEFGPGPVEQGGAGSGGRILIEPALARTRPTAAHLGGSLGGRYDSAVTGLLGRAEVSGQLPGLELSTLFGWHQAADYTAPGGITVPAEARRIDAAGLLGFWPTPDQRLWVLVSHVRDRDTDYPALPMDLDHSGAWLTMGGWQLRRSTGWLRRLELQVGQFLVDHGMSNTHKPNRPQLEAAAETESSSRAAGLRVALQPTPALRLTLGSDLALLERDAERTRVLPQSNQIFRDHLWPAARQLDLGGYASLGYTLGSAWRFGLGLRGDRVASQAGAADDLALGGQTIRQQWVRFHGAAAADQTEHVEWLGAGWGSVAWEPRPELDAYLRLGLAMRAAGLSERFYAFAPSPGGFQLGNPTLTAERSWGSELGVNWERPWLRTGLRVFVSWVQDYILPTQIAQQEVNGDGILDTVRSFANVDARLVGAELELTLRPRPWLSLPATLAGVRGTNSTDARPLPVIPPWNGRAALRLEPGWMFRPWLEFGCRFAAAQGRIDERYPEDESSAFHVWRVELGGAIGDWLEGRLAVENLLDATYHEHLTREALLAVGDLAAGDEIPAPGRSLVVQLEGRF